MPTPPRRARFQIHLSTAIVLMFVAGGLIGLNVRGKTGEFFVDSTVYSHVYGWPFATHPPTDAGWDLLIWPAPWVFWMLNTAVAMFILFVAWCICEWLIRWRAARKGG